MAIAVSVGAAQPSLRPIVTKLASPTPISGRISQRSSCKCQATSNNNQAASTVISSGCDLYELLGIEGGATQSEIKQAYRWLQKRCHPDVAGDVAGHDMSVLLNDAYAILSNAETRSSYDKVRAEWMQYQGYTGEPMYSRWLGPEYEERAVFVDETRCVGCLKCALIASNTFAIERSFGRARAVGQWGDPEYAIEDAIRSCPVDCISWVDRGRIPALEYVMSKQPRCAVNIGIVDNNIKERNVDVFQATDKFLKRKIKFENQESCSTRATADAIHTRTGQWWKFFVGRSYIPAENPEATRRGAIVHQHASSPYSFLDSKLMALYEAAIRRKLGVSKSRQGTSDDYWKPAERPPAVRKQQQEFHPAKAAETSQTSYTKEVSPFKSSKLAKNSSPSEYEMVLTGAPWFVSLVAGLVVALTGSQTQRDIPLEVRASGADGPLLRLSQNLRFQELMANDVMHVLFAVVAWYVISTVVCNFARELAIIFLDDQDSH